MLLLKHYVVTNADKAGNTKAYQGLKAGKKNAVTGKPMYVAAPHLKESEPLLQVSIGSLRTPFFCIIGPYATDQ